MQTISKPVYLCVLKLPVYQVVKKGGLMYYLTERSVMANDKSRVLAATANGLIAPLREDACVEREKEAVFTQVDLWNLQKHMRTIHVTDRFPRTWEGSW